MQAIRIIGMIVVHNNHLALVDKIDHQGFKRLEV
jgi:hypothetical protein